MGCVSGYCKYNYKKNMVMRYVQYLVKVALLFTLLFSVSCSQKSSEVVYKGHLYFTKGKFYDDSNFNSVKDESQVIASQTRKVSIVETDSPNKVLVKQGDTLYSIARANKVAIRSLIEYNKLKPPYVIYPGNILNISTRKTHLVKSGENLTRLSILYGVSLVELANVNNFPEDYKIKTGEMLILPYNATLSNNQTSAVVAMEKSKAPSKTSSKTVKTSRVRENMTSLAPISFTWPVSQGKIIEKFGPKSNGVHNDGVNIKAPFGTPIKSAAKGKVVYVGSELRGYGNLIIIKHPHNWLTAYAHNNETYVSKNQKVLKGEVIATVGSTGNVEAPQLHFGLRKGRKAVNPQKHIKETS